jgi:hypothetical protein
MPPKASTATKRGPNRPKKDLSDADKQLLARRASLARIRRVKKELHEKARPKRAHRGRVSAARVAKEITKRDKKRTTKAKLSARTVQRRVSKKTLLCKRKSEGFNATEITDAQFAHLSQVSTRY